MTDTDEWIEHDGSAWPEGLAKDDMVIVRFRDGFANSHTPEKASWWFNKIPHHSNYTWNGFAWDIIAYKVIK